MIDYTYNIRGWMTHINKDQMPLADLGGRLFSYRIRYNEKEGLTNPDPVLFSGKDVVLKYNGNIAEVDWRSVENIGNNPSLTPKRYGYVYDRLNRLTAGYYQNPNNPNSKENTESLDYDLNGNITNLYRTSVIESGNTATAIDRLEYFYGPGNNSNRLSNITDHQNNPTGYEGGNQQMGYDLNGNMIVMPDKGISKIAYNYLNLPDKLNYAKEFETVTVNTKYGSDGGKLQKQNMTTVDGISGPVTVKKTTDYLDGFQYLKTENIGLIGMSDEMMSGLETLRVLERQAFSVEPMAVATLASKNNDLQFFPTAEGFYDYKKDQYIYQYKDHLGNNRVSFGRNSTGALEITDTNDYYPFGMNHLKSGNSFFGINSYKNYKYNGKELQESGMYDYGARFYMPDIGRWGVVDPLAETSRRWSTYAYAYNNPIRFIDPDGRSSKDIIVLTANGSFKASKELMYKTAEGRRIWDKYGASKTDDIYINSSVFPSNSRTFAETYTLSGNESFVKNNTISNIGKTYPSLGSFEGLDVSKSNGKNVHLMAFNEDFFPNTASEKYTKITISPTLGEVKEEYDLSDLSKVVYHETKAHIEDRTGNADDDHKKLGESKFQGYIRPNSPMDIFDKQLIKIIQIQNAEKYHDKK
ncbi:RHS repeat-associated core domain-containing protein [Chryseobacterium sp. JJR-5R]|uniref:RHS repeat-associated core domain-containing protein n=1 Tax=Chryseobacterium sp. JJR-5R TaxID=3093923 RepID=UPI002A74F126|nr:RHS repeat-associated core domain-containing protein [Chryseobacterium sp. JJR-5R]WPO81507.1 RHS repeat-associated core domain-containing protein [Chryseobacterium sp. JJR-5R]